MGNLKIKLFAVLSLLMVFLTISSVVATSSYDGATTTNVAFASDGKCTVSDSFGVTYTIEGTPGSTGTVTTDFRSANPQPTANIPSGISLTHFVVVTFNIDPTAFTQAHITIPYTDSDVQDVQPPYSIFKYNPATDTYTELAATADTYAKTFTIAVTSVDDPLFAIGGSTSVTDNNGGFSPIAWIALAASVVIVVLLAVVGVWYFKKDSS